MLYQPSLSTILATLDFNLNLKTHLMKEKAFLRKISQHIFYVSVKTILLSPYLTELIILIIYFLNNTSISSFINPIFLHPFLNLQHRFTIQILIQIFPLIFSHNTSRSLTSLFTLQISHHLFSIIFILTNRNQTF